MSSASAAAKNFPLNCAGAVFSCRNNEKETMKTAIKAVQLKMAFYAEVMPPHISPAENHLLPLLGRLCSNLSLTANKKIYCSIIVKKNKSPDRAFLLFGGLKHPSHPSRVRGEDCGGVQHGGVGYPH